MRRLVFDGDLAVLDRVVQIDAEVETCREVSHHKLRLHTHTDTPAVGLRSAREIGLAERRLTVVIGSIVEHIHTASETEDTMSPPIGGYLDLGAEEGLSVPVIDLSRRTGPGELNLTLLRP